MKKTEIPQQYLAEREKIQTGDIILFSDKSLWSPISRTIQLFTKSKYQHVGIALVTEKEGVVFIFESTTIGMGYKEGVQINLLSDRVRTLGPKHKCFVRHLNEPLKRSHKAKLWSMRNKYQETKYETSLLDLFLAGVGWTRDRGGSEDKAIFCSELVAMCFQYIDIIDPSRHADAYNPSDFSTEKHLDTLNGTKWSDEIPLN